MNIPEFPSIKSVPKKMLANIWVTISDKPLPETQAFTLADKDFAYLLILFRKIRALWIHRVREYGVDFDNSFIEAFSFKVEDCFVVFVKQSATLQKSLEHELRHILYDDY